MTTPTGDNLAPSVPVEAPRVRFGFQHVAALAVAILIPVLIYLFRDQIRSMEHLGYLGGFLTMFVGNATVFLPVPGLIIVFALGATLNPLLVGLAAGPGAALGELVGYLMGYSSSGVVENTLLYHRIEGWVRRYGPIVITIMAAIPNPVFDIAGIASGALGIKWWQFLIAAWIGKTIQAIAIAYLGALGVTWVERLLA